MKVSFNWLKEYIDGDVDLNELVEILTNTGLEVASVEKFEEVKGGLEGLVVGEVKQVEKHPNADRLSLTKVDVGNGDPLSIVCGAPNVKEGQKVAVAPVGSVIHHINGEELKIKKGKIRGEVSMGMICAEDEIGLGEDHDGIMVLGSKAKVGQALREHFNLSTDYTIEIDLTPNRTDAISHLGVARDYIAVKNLEIGAEQRKVKVPDVSKFEVDDRALEMDIIVEDKSACPRYSGVTMTEIKIGESPAWLKTRLKAVGLNPINNVVDAANYIMYETGQPMHVFDADHITSEKVVVGMQQSGTKFVTLDEVERKLDGADLMINNNTEAMCIAGVFGGLESGVKNETKNIFIESAYFSPSGIRKTARRHGLSTDASYRYERGANPDVTIYALKRLALLLKKVAGGNVSCDIMDEYPFKIEATELSLRFEYLNQVAGQIISKDDVRKILNSLDFDLMIESGDTLKLRVPGYRTDVRREIDVIEEVLRIYGYNNIELPGRMQSSISSRQKDGVSIEGRSASLLSSIGYKEVMNNSLTSSQYTEETSQLIAVKNPLSNELNVLRMTLLNGGLQSIQYNLNRKAEHLKLFEFGNIYFKSGKKYDQSRHLMIWSTGMDSAENWHEKQRKTDFYDLKKDTEQLLIRLGLKVDQLKTNDAAGDNAEIGLSYDLGGQHLMRIFKVDQSTLDRFEIEQDVFVSEIQWDVLVKHLNGLSLKFEPLPKYPSMRRDLALLLDDAVSYAEVEKEVRKNGTGLLRNVNLFDVYKGKGIDPGKKSYAISLLFRDDNKTLTDKQIDKIMDKTIAGLKKSLKAELR